MIIHLSIYPSICLGVGDLQYDWSCDIFPFQIPSRAENLKARWLFNQRNQPFITVNSKIDLGTFFPADGQIFIFSVLVTTRLGSTSNINFVVTRSVNDFPTLSVAGADVQYLPASEGTSLKAISSYVPCALINSSKVNLIYLSILSYLSTPIYLSIYLNSVVTLFSFPLYLYL